MIAVILAFAAAAPPANSVASPPFPPTHGSDGLLEKPPRAAVDLDYEGKAKALRAEMHALKLSDGGQLTAQHRAYMLDRLEALLSAYQDEVRRVDPMAADAVGSKRP